MSDQENTRLNVYERVTAAVVSAIEAGTVTYRMPWTVRQDKGFSPISVGSGNAYKGLNTLVLWSQAQTKGYSSALWGSFNHWRDLGATVRKNEHGSPVVYWGALGGKQAADSDEGEGTHRTRLFVKYSTVFNADQVDGLRMPKRFEPKLSHNQRIERAETFFAPLAEVRDGGNRAYYRPDTPEAIYLPGFDQFAEAEGYYSVAAHETGHYTAHPSRHCNRELGKRFGDSAYAVEELVAELCSAFVMARLELELTPRADHSSYLSSWLKVLKSDTRAIFTAAAQAQRAADWMFANGGKSAAVAEVAA